MSARHISEPKGFQRATAEAALATLTRKDGPRRFLVADEVGLGKTVVARTIIAEMIKRRRRPLVVFYVSSNLNIAHQNRAKLLELLPTEAEQKDASAPADRLTLAANPAKRPRHDKLHLYTLTPDTSVPMYRRRGGFGRLEERALIFRLLKGRFPSLDTEAFARKCRGNQARETSWGWALQQHAHIEGVRELQDRFFDALAGDEHLKLSRVDAECLSIAAERERPSRLMSSLRTALAVAALRDVRPDLVIFDEFQKFRELLIDPPNASPDPVTRSLRGEGRGESHAVLLLSATPYRLYSSRQDEVAGLSHHQDFFELIRFLFGSETTQPKSLERDFLDFGAKMLAKETPDFEQLRKLRDDIQDRLRPVLSRTERPKDTTLRSQENHPSSEIRSEDLRVFKHWVARLHAAKNSRRGKFDLMAFAVPYWLSIPLPIQTMGLGYMAWRHAERRRRRREEPTLKRSQRDHLDAPKLWPHPQLRALNKIVPASRLALPWIAPSLPWWALQGPWSEPGASGGKLLIFTRFKAVPPALASLLSFNLEASVAHRLGDSYRRAGEAQPLQFKSDRPTLPALFFPSPTLIAFTDPRRDNPSKLSAVRNSMRRQVGQLLRQRLGVQVRKSGGKRPLWKLLPALEHARATFVPDSGLPSWPELRAHLVDVSDQAEIFRKMLTEWDKYARAGLQSVTQSEVAALAEFALSGPGVVLGRALYRFDRNCVTNKNFRGLMQASWNGLRPYLNRSVFQATLTRRGQPYTKAIPEAVVSGNLESVLDEHLWIASKLDADAIEHFPSDLLKMLGLREGRHRLYEPGAAYGSFSLRCHAAMPFADAKVENVLTGGESRLRTDDMRRSFNTPFWPHVLATTSLGQEGLDFHVWCRQLLHWDLCPSPLDLEQREGRIQRFGGLSVRSALAEKLRRRTLEEAAGGISPWAILAGHADHEFQNDTSGRTPWWSCPNEKIDRLFVVLPQSRQTARFDQLGRLRWVYRLALGQPHQQDFIETVSRLPDDGRQQFALRLSAWKG
jgi:hypothetical protein